MTRLHSLTLAETGFANGAPAPRSRPRVASLITAGVMALSLVLASSVPARAGGRDDLAKALIAAIVIGAILSATRNSDAAPPPARPPQPVQRPRLPAVCALEFGGQRRVYSQTCLHREGFDYRLPERCASEARIYGRWDRIYDAACLRAAGYRVPGR